jgi:hypothetical protein
MADLPRAACRQSQPCRRTCSQIVQADTALLDKIQNVRHVIQGGLRRIGDPFERHLTEASDGALADNFVGDFMRRSVFGFQNQLLRSLAVPALALMLGASGVHAQSASGEQKPAANAPTPAEVAKDSQKKTDEFVEATNAIGGPAGNPECVWLGRRVVVLMWRDDLDTAFRHLDLYDRFGCPGGHVQATFRCLVRFGALDPKVPDSLNGRVHACWINPSAQPQNASIIPVTPAPSLPPRQQASPKPSLRTRRNSLAFSSGIFARLNYAALKTPRRHMSC